MRNWFSELKGLKKNGGREELPDTEQLRPFEQFLGRPKQECLIITWLCVNYKKRDAQTIVQLFEQLSAEATHEELSEALVDLMAAGWVQVGLEDYNEGTYQVTFTHRVEVALRTGNRQVFTQKVHPKDRRDRSILRMYATAVLFKSKITDIDAWVEISGIFLDLVEHELARVIRLAKLDRLTQAVVLYIYVMHAVEGSHTEWRALSQLFSDNRMAARRLLDQWKKPSWKPIRSGLLEMRTFPMGPTVLFPAESCQRRIYGLADELEQMDELLPPSLQRIAAEKIAARKLFYNPVEGEQIERLCRMLKPAIFKKFQQTINDSSTQRGITVLLSGGPGTGKTELARQVARATGRDLLLFNVSEQRDKFFGESEKRIKEIFTCYNELLQTRHCAPILFFNEGDSVFRNRYSNESSTSSTENAIQTILLNEMESFDGILICTTNRPESFDAAFARRFLMQITIHAPTASVRLQLLRHLFPEIPATESETLADRFEFTAAELENFRKLYYIQTLTDKGQVDKVKALAEFLQSISKKTTKQIGFRI